MNYDDAVRTLVKWHSEGDQPPQMIVLFPDADQREIRLLEVTDLVPETGEVYPVAFGPTRELPFRTVVAQVTPQEWAAMQDGRIALPEGWDLGSSREVSACSSTRPS